MFKTLSYDKVISEKLNVMDATAIILCRDQKMPLRVYNMNKPGMLKSIVIDGSDDGTLVE
jgi:uridylate kinase